MSRRKGKRQSGWSIFAAPSLLALASMTGLISGLLGDGLYDGIAVAGLALPLICLIACLFRST